MDDLTNLLGFDPGILAADADAFFALLGDAHAAGAGVTARAESPDGRVAVEYSGTSGVSALHIDPRAMRAGAEDLAGTILELIGRARREAEARGRERVTEVLGDGNALLTDRGALGDRLREVTGAVHENLAAAAETMERLRGMLRT
ncbi:YbaB/EbfC family nucleoid-associated protein [Actinomadura roseirufa]|uniref:YbaB/EbfC family nucleoid-associated protein n=1 Tax=Actinomadura roseirufa TaxID=2094049 RepID=UPI001040E3FE|nr:YbaB/EbfC family nucleoid-associated protein [Actinomadura roseirufa]